MCDKALRDKRCTWRHDSVLATLLQLLVPVLMQRNASTPPSTRPAPIAFVSAGSKPLPNDSGPNRPDAKCLLLPANDWQLLIDFDCCRMVFPVLITATNERPDVVIWSTKTKTVILIELTCPAEENFANASAYKLGRYAGLVEQIRLAGWKVFLRTVEAGARGFVSHAFQRTLRELGFSSAEATRACKDISLVSAKCSYSIWLGRKSKTWNASRELVVPPGKYLSPAPTHTPAPLLSNQTSKGSSDWHLHLKHTTGVQLN